MPATRRYVSWSGVVVTPLPSGTPIPFDGVTQVNVDGGGGLLEFSGDADKFPTLIIPDGGAPSMTFDTAEVSKVLGLPVGTPVGITAIHHDAKNGIAPGGGAKRYTIANGVIAQGQGGGAHRQVGKATLAVKGVSLDGQTNPLLIETL